MRVSKEVAAKRAMFDVPGPQLTEEKYGPEPCLRDLITLYYTQVGCIPAKRAKELTQKYIEAITRG